MSSSTKLLLLLSAATTLVAPNVRAVIAEPAERSGESHAASPFTVDGNVALHSFMALADGHLQKIGDLLQMVAASGDARSADWNRLRGPLAEIGKMCVPAAFWFARPDGSYWTVAEGLARGNLADRPYFPRLLSGQTVIGDLIVSRSTSRNSAVVAVPVRGSDHSVVGALGASVYLDKLGEIVRREMGGLAPGLVFFAIDSKPIGALHSDPGMIFTEPMKLGDEGMRRAFSEILAGSEGTVRYTFRGRRRTMLYRKSNVTGWWYALGVSRE